MAMGDKSAESSGCFHDGLGMLARAMGRGLGPVNVIMSFLLGTYKLHGPFTWSLACLNAIQLALSDSECWRTQRPEPPSAFLPIVTPLVRVPS